MSFLQVLSDIQQVKLHTEPCRAAAAAVGSTTSKSTQEKLMATWHSAWSAQLPLSGSGPVDGPDFQKADWHMCQYCTVHCRQAAHMPCTLCRVRNLDKANRVPNMFLNIRKKPQRSKIKPTAQSQKCTADSESACKQHCALPAVSAIRINLLHMLPVPVPAACRQPAGWHATPRTQHKLLHTVGQTKPPAIWQPYVVNSLLLHSKQQVAKAAVIASPCLWLPAEQTEHDKTCLFETPPHQPLLLLMFLLLLALLASAAALSAARCCSCCCRCCWPAETWPAAVHLHNNSTSEGRQSPGKAIMHTVD